jgi:hypothetical protein
VRYDQEVTRYVCDDPYTLHQDDTGDLVDYSDYEALEAERDTLLASLADPKQLVDALVTLGAGVVDDVIRVEQVSDVFSASITSPIKVLILPPEMTP